MYANASKLLGLLKVAKVRNNLEAELKKIERCQLLILDDLFLVPLDAKERPILLDIIEDRHERKSIIITSQYPSSSWYDMVGDPTVADAILDRIVHSAHTIELTGEKMAGNNAQGICPDGWHLPWKYEYETLISYAGGMKGLKVPSGGWCNGEGCNTTGFNALLCGYLPLPEP